MTTKTAWIVIAVIVVVAALGWFAFAAMPASAPTLSETEQTADTAAEGAATSPAAGGDADESATIIVSYSDAGFYPKEVNVRLGDTVRFVNQSTHDMWVAADEHPTHTEYDGTSTREHCAGGTATNGTFDQCSKAANGASYEYTFMKAGTHEYHNHSSAADTGTVTVQ